LLIKIATQFAQVLHPVASAQENQVLAPGLPQDHPVTSVVGAFPIV
jgi:hypothetical protein